MCFYAFIYCRRWYNCIRCLVISPFCCLWRIFTRQRLLLLFKILIIYIATIVVLFFVCQNWPYSMFYHLYGKKEANYERIKIVNNQRRYKAHKVLSQLNPAETRQMYLQNAKAEHLKYAIGVVTVARETYVPRFGQLEYLTQVMTQLHDVIEKSGATNNIFPFMCIVDSNPENHKEIIGLSKFFPNITKLYSPAFAQNNKITSREERHKQDYVFCLEAAQQYNTDYIMLLEDDAYPNDNFFEILEYLVDTKLESHIQRGEKTQNKDRWAWVKLMISYSLTKYHRNWFFFYQWIALSILLAGSACLAYYLYTLCLKSHKSQVISSYATSFYAFFITFVYFLMIIWIMGRPYFVQLRSASPYFYTLEPGTSCCIPAVLFQPSEVQNIVNFLNSIKCTTSLPLDIALDKYRIKSQVKQYLVSPNIFSHIGFYSSVRKTFNQNDAEFV